jgi:hypothetical protein
MEVPQQPPILWEPCLSPDNLNFEAMYLVHHNDLAITFNANDSFDETGVFLKISGRRLYGLLIKAATAKAPKRMGPFSHSAEPKRRAMCKRFICFASVTDRTNIAKTIRYSLNLPPCINEMLSAVLVRPRGERHNIRFNLNAYLLKRVDCNKCAPPSCLIPAIKRLYDHDTKCVSEIEKLVMKTYSPLSCEKMKNCQPKLCPKEGKCKGSSAIYNF